MTWDEERDYPIVDPIEGELDQDEHEQDELEAEFGPRDRFDVLDDEGEYFWRNFDREGFDYEG